jgi:hypothetical protein
MTPGRCSTCSLPLVVAGGVELCARSCCPGHEPDERTLEDAIDDQLLEQYADLLPEPEPEPT